MQSGVQNEMYEPYVLDDLNFTIVGHPRHNDMHCYLTGICMGLTNDDVFVRDRKSHHWIKLKPRAARTKLLTEYCGAVKINGVMTALTDSDIDAYLKNALPRLSGTISLPMASPYVLYGGEKLLNTWNNTLAMGNSAEIGACEEVLRIIRNALCGRADILTLSEMLGRLKSRDPSEIEFRVLMNWIAAIFQRPGINLQTNLWLIGHMTGIGKGTFIRLLRLVFGASAVGKVKEKEMDRGWTNFIEGHLIMEADEYQGANKIEFAQMVKRDTTNTVISIMKRHNDVPRDIPNIANWIFTLNNEHSVLVEVDERRNALFKTTIDPQWKARSLALNQLWDNDRQAREAVTAGFASILTDLAVEWDIIATAPWTGIKIDNRMSSQNAVETWIDMDSTIPRGVVTKGADLFLTYCNWRRTYAEDSRIRSIQAWGRHMMELARNGRVERHGDHPAEYKIPASDKQPADKPKSNILDLKERLRRHDMT